MSRTDLRDYQRRFHGDVRQAGTNGYRAVLGVMPTGSGKTRCGAEFVLGAVAKGKRSTWLAHRIELVMQAHERLRQEGVTDIGVVAATAPHLYRPNALVQVASIQTLLARGNPPPADLLVIDEAHHVVASEYRKLADHYANAFKLGLTATPLRSDGAPMNKLFTAIVTGPSVAELQAMGALVACETIAPDRHLRGKLAQHPVDAWREYSGGRPTIVFAKHVAHGKELVEEFRAAGARARFIDQETPDVLRTKALEDFASGACDVLINVYILTEGFDCPSAAVCILARSIGSVGMFIQCGGRVLRPAPGKTHATLVDLAGSVHLHGLLEDPREYSLEGRGIIKKPGLPHLRQCKECGATGAVLTRLPACPRCGFVFPLPEAPRIIGEKLDRITSVSVEDEKAEFQRLVSIQDTGGHRQGWAIDAFRQKFGKWPEYQLDNNGKVRAA